jgi:transcriptional regulator with XRE-family HTH domain
MVNQLKAWRKARNLTQEKAAYIVGITPRHWQRLEAGTNRLTPTIERLIGIL